MEKRERTFAFDQFSPARTEILVISTVALVAVNPELVLGYSVVYADCSADFHALALPEKAECPDGGGQRPSYAMRTYIWVLSLVSAILVF